jgi:hypothetical protein
MSLSKLNYPRIVAVTGRKFNGKDTIAEYLVKYHGYTQMSYAEPIKHICKYLFDFNDEQCYGDKKETLDPRWNTTPRKLFQFIGTDLFRNQMNQVIPDIDDKFWALCCHKKIQKLLDSDKNARVVISDVRFPNELSMLQELGYNTMSIRVSRPSMNNTDNKDTHISELLIEKLQVDHELLNDTTKEDLFMKVTKLFEMPAF